jgi:aspartyl-tRNA synthetase
VLSTPFPRITYDEAMRRYGIDKPDLRMPGLTDVRSAFRDEDLQALAVDPNLPVVVVCIPKVGELSRKERDDNRPLFDAGKGAKMIDDWKRLEKSFPEAVSKIRELVACESTDLLVLVAGDATSHVKASDTKTHGHLSEREIGVYAAAGNLRVELARRYADRHGVAAMTDQVVNAPERHLGQQVPGDTAFRPIWVTDFPMFEFDQASQRWLPAHHPFTSPHEEDMERLVSDPASVRARYYDLAMNGLELGSGSIRDERRRGAFALRLFPRSAHLRHASARRHCPGPGPHRHDSGRSPEPARSNCFSQDGKSHRLDGRCTDRGKPSATKGVAHPDHQLTTARSQPVRGSGFVDPQERRLRESSVLEGQA